MSFLPQLAVFSAFALLSSAGYAQVVINEIFYNSPADLDRLEYVEIHNPTSESVDLTGWQFSKGIEFTFTEGTVLKSGAYWVLCADEDLFNRLYGVTPNGVFSKSLDNGGETITLKNAEGVKIDSVTYDDDAPWPKSPDGYSASLERICPTAAAREDVANWAPSILSEDYSSKPSGTPGRRNSVYARILPPVVKEVTFGSEVVAANQSIDVRARVLSPSAVTLLYRVASAGEQSEETSLPMSQSADGFYIATIPGQKANRIIRLRVKVAGAGGSVRHFPHPNEIRPALSIYVDSTFPAGQIPVAHFFNVGKDERANASAYRTNHAASRGRRGGFDRGRGRGREMTEEERLRRDTAGRLSEDSLQKVWASLTLEQSLADDQTLMLAQVLGKARGMLADLRQTAESTRDVRAFSESLGANLAELRQTLRKDTGTILSQAQSDLFATVGAVEERRGRGFGGPADMLPRIFNVEESWFRHALVEEVSGDQLGKLVTVHRDALAKRHTYAEELAQGGEIDFRAVIGEVRDLGEDLEKAISKVLSRHQLDSLNPGGRGRGFGGLLGGGFGRRPAESSIPQRPQGRSALIYTDPVTQKSQLFDFVNITQRKSGYKVRLHKDKTLNGLTTLNVLYERNEGTILNEALAYELYRQAGNATAQAGFFRVLIDGQVAGFHLWFEQPNRAFFRRHDIDDKGNLYKLIWMGSHRPSRYTPENKFPERMDIVGKHEKKTHPHDGYDDIVNIIELLETAEGDDDKMWQIIQDHFEVDQVINYFAVNSLLSHWDGFFNNYFLYHDLKGSGKWSMYPWDQDSTWSQRMGNPAELSTLPINYGSEGARAPGAEPRSRDDNDSRDRRRRGGFGGFGGGRGAPNWWRDGGDISRPLLANPQFYQKFRARLKILATTVYSKERFGPKIDAVTASIEPEVRVRALAFERDPEVAVREFQATMDRMHEHMALRTQWVLKQLGKISLD